MWRTRLAEPGDLTWTEHLATLVKQRKNAKYSESVLCSVSLKMLLLVLFNKTNNTVYLCSLNGQELTKINLNEKVLKKIEYKNLYWSHYLPSSSSSSFVSLTLVTSEEFRERPWPHREG